MWTVSSRWRSTAMCSCPLMVVSTGCRLPSSAPPAPSLSPTSPSIGRTAPSSSSETIDGVRGLRDALGWVWVEVEEQHRRLLKAGWPGPTTWACLDDDI
ncbi:cholinergic receptor, nicotinic, gamma polypeptide, isoform CRA_b [Rattus norvegicus]|uniref:Cholinergic receptor, nicotinic, gamma polypeptide, isoform CRA_b n=1 Tax=Rattus norvegicus TaxID=10116 RepID=A6JWL5_RAT|nr:cholinergic receptor, nicotinic, gamma polypeptide, isoform CRA_b [Rattus norvegicus]